MSTFKGVVAEFPDIRIDFFRQSPGIRPPLACFLSHVHSDHLAGLDTLKSPFVYCSPATKEILMRLEKYPHRMNFALKILESRKQTYKHLDKLLKPIPLETPTKIELTPGNFITVTLFDANHCPGAVMFLIENDEKSILYTGDVRSEASFISNLRRNPYLIEYTTGIKTLECIYLDTSNADNISFPSQADGLAELLEKVSKYPSDTIFHFSAWTYGYENIHVDRYKMRIYKSLVGDPSNGSSTTGPFISHEGPVLTGYQCGNAKQDGCLTENHDVRIHSCEKGLQCPVVSNNGKIVWITPIVTRTVDGEEIAEVGVGGGGGDLVQRPELEVSSADDIEGFIGLLEGLDEETEGKLRQKLLSILLSPRMAISLEDLGLLGFDRDQNEMSLSNFAKLVSKSASKGDVAKTGPKYSLNRALPKRITFPFSRHSSFPELCDLVAAFSPKDVYPCTVDELEWHEGVSIKAQFGRHCSDAKFRHDFEMRELQAQRLINAASVQTHTTSSEESIDGSQVIEQAKVVRVLGRDAHGRLRILEGDQIHHGVSTSTARHTSPPREIISISPGSQSQSLRRKLILEDLEESRKTKRARLVQTDGPGSSPLGRRNEVQLTSLPENVGSSSPVAGNSSSEQGTPGSDHSEERGEDDEIKELHTFYDGKDDVKRCGLCGHELQCPYFGYCSYCEEGQFQQPYFEDLGPESRPRLEIAFNEFDDLFMSKEDRLKYVGDYLDDNSSAYDTQDEDNNFNEDYEVNSFIDDAPEDSNASEGEEGSVGDIVDDEETYWEQKFKKLQAEHQAVVSKNQALEEKHNIVVGALVETEEKYYDLLDELGIRPSDDEDDDEVDEDGVLVVNPVAPDPVVTELVLSSAQDQSQNSDIPDERIRDRAEAFEAVNDENQGWHNISLLSTGHNHTEADIEL